MPEPKCVSESKVILAQLESSFNLVSVYAVSQQQYLLKYIYLNLHNTCLFDYNHLLYMCDDLCISRVMQM